MTHSAGIWNSSEIDAAAALMAARRPTQTLRETLVEIARAVGCSFYAAEARYRRRGPSFDDAPQRRPQRSADAGRYIRLGDHGAPAHVLAARERRNDALDRRDLTGLLCGDPPPGFSALDRPRPVSMAVKSSP